MADSPRLVQVFRSSCEEGLYLYVEKKEGIARVPEALLNVFGKLESAMMLMLSTQTTLANADATKVLLDIVNKGFYLQLPPAQIKQTEAEAIGGAS